MKKLVLNFLSFGICIFLSFENFAQTPNTTPLPKGETVIGNHLHAGSVNAVWSDANSLYFNYRGNATETHFWNLGGTTGQTIMTLLNSGRVGLYMDRSEKRKRAIEKQDC